MAKNIDDFLSDISCEVFLQGDEIHVRGPSARLTPSVIGYLRQRRDEVVQVAKLNQRVGKPTPSRNVRHLTLNLRSGTSAANIFCIHPITGSCWIYKQLCLFLPDFLNVLGIYPPGFSTTWEPVASIEALARIYAETIVSVQPKGPFILCGYSFGGLVAMEIGRFLHTHGHSVAPLLLVDTELNFKSDDPVGEDVAFQPLWLWHFFTGAYMDWPLADRAVQDDAFLKLSHGGRLEWLMYSARRLDIPDRPLDMTEISRMFRFLVSAFRARQAYRPTVYPGTVKLWVAGESPDTSYIGDWHAVAEDRLNLYAAPGDHFSVMLDDVNVGEMGRRLSRHLSLARG